MKPEINLISIFERVEKDDGEVHYTGTLKLSELKKTKKDELRVVVLPGEQVHESLHHLLGSHPGAKDGLFVFAETTPVERKKKS